MRKGFLKKLSLRLATWKGMMLSFGGRITPHRSVMCSLTIFTLSSYKVLMKVWRDTYKIQGRFLWGGSEEKRCIHWIGWRQVCKSFWEGGSMVRNAEQFNLALLQNWKWRILEGIEALWMEVLKAPYRDMSYCVLSGCFCGVKRYASSWWNYLIYTDKRKGVFPPLLAYMTFF